MNEKQDELGITGASRARLAYDELLASQLVLALRRWKNRGTNRSPDALPAAAIATPDSDTSSGSGGGGGGEAGAVVRGGPKGKGIVDEGLRRLPFALTQNQKKGKEAWDGVELKCCSVSVYGMPIVVCEARGRGGRGGGAFHNDEYRSVYFGVLVACRAAHDAQQHWTYRHQ